MKKIILKQFYKPIIFTFFTILSLGNLKAQTHSKAAANCIYHDDYVKTASKTKNTVSCVDCYCKICGDKKQKEKEAKRKAQELANKQKTEKPKLEDQKKLAENKKKLEAENQKEKQKAKDNEAILVAPKPKVEKNMTVALSVEDKKIFDIYDSRNNKESLIIAYCEDDCLVKLQYPEVVTNSGRIFLRKYDTPSDKYIFTILKDNINLNLNQPYTSYEGELSEAFKNHGLMIVRFENNQKIFWNDIVDLKGNVVFDNTEYFDIRYSKDTKMFKLEKQGTGLYGAGKFTEEYDPVTKKITPIQ